MRKASFERLTQQLAFIYEIDKVKNIFRQTLITDKSREENDAEHSWHLAMMVLVLAEYSNQEIDILKVLKMVLIHDIVEIDAGDVFFFDPNADAAEKFAKEQQAADRIFGLLPAEQFDEFKQLWLEFEDCKTAEAKFARAIDRVHPFLHNMVTDGHTWNKHGVKADQVKGKMSVMAQGSETLHQMMLTMIGEAVDEGILTE